MDRIPVAGPWITEKEVAYAADAAAHDWYADAGRYVKRFERAMADHAMREFAVAMPHCTAAIHTALLAFGVGPGDEVVIPDVTWIATAAPISYVGATPVFADIDAKTWCITPESFEAVITSRTRAVIPVDLYGSMPLLEEICAIASSRGIQVIEDAAEAIGSSIHGRPAGSFGDVSVFSFHGSKTVATGEGGMLLTNNSGICDRVRFLADHGRPPGDRFFRNTEIGFKYKMSSLQAAVGLAQVERIAELVSRKREINGWYREELRGLKGLRLNHEPDGVHNSYWMTTAVFEPETLWSSRSIIEALDQAGIDSRPFFSPLSDLDPYRETPQGMAARERNTISYRVGPRGVNLPSAMNLSRSDVDRVSKSVRALLDAPQTAR